jgi:hypothetical protein
MSQPLFSIVMTSKNEATTLPRLMSSPVKREFQIRGGAVTFSLGQARQTKENRGDRRSLVSTRQTGRRTPGSERQLRRFQDQHFLGLT